MMTKLCILFAIFALAVADYEDLQLVPGETVKTEEISSKSLPVENQDSESFKPTHEWQTVIPGQRVPGGLHYRLNLETGKNEARLLPGDDPTKYDKFSHDPKGPVNVGQKYFTVSELQDSLKNLNDRPAPNAFGEPILDFPLEEEDAEREDQIKASFKPYYQLKQDYEALKKAARSDLEIMRDLLTEYRQGNSTDARRLEILEDFEYHVHQIDNAVNFVDIKGLEIVREAINHTDPEFRQSAAFVVGSASQSNPKVQVAMVEEGIFHDIIRKFATEPSAGVRRKYIYALSSILRHFPFAQKKFIELGGIELVLGAFKQNGGDKQKIKLLTLVDDLIAEKKNYEVLSLRDLPSSFDKERLKQYREIPLLENLVEKGWCSIIPQQLAQPDWDSQEKVLRAMQLIFEACKREFVKSRSTLVDLKEQYEEQLRSTTESDSNDYLQELLEKVEEMLARWRTHQEL